MPLQFQKRSADVPLIRFLPDETAGPTLVPSQNSDAARSIPPEEIQLLTAAATELGTSLENLLLTAFACLLSRLTRQDVVSIWVGPDEYVHFNLEDDSPFREVVKQAAKRSTGTQIANQSVQYEFRADGAEAAPEMACGLHLEVHEVGMRLKLTSPIGLWQTLTLKKWLSYLVALAHAAAEDPQLPVTHLPLWTEQEARNFYAMLNQTKTEFHGPATVPGLFAAQAGRRAEITAVACGGRNYSYRELDERSTELALQLIAAGAGPNRAVAVCMERSVDLPMSLLAVLKAGAYYVPLDPHNPSQRLLGILEECAPVALLSDSKIAELLESALQERPDASSLPVLRVDQLQLEMRRTKDTEDSGIAAKIKAIQPDDLAYTIYTSGTTGKPKGVSIRHKALRNLICSMAKKPGAVETDRTLAVAPISFDIATMDMFLPICTGGTLVLASRSDSVDPFRLADLLKEHDITCLQATPATWRMLVTSGWAGKRGLKMISGGEAIPRELSNELIRLGGELWNCYGPTETTIYSAVLKIEREEGIVPVGPPMPNTTFYVMDKGGKPVPPGVPGELYIGGIGVSPGYVARPEMTSKRFVKDRVGHDPEAVVFCTGDLVRLTRGNQFEFYGRLDHQVKLRGFRIELGEIESTLRSHPAIHDAVAVLREDIPGEPRLVSYVIAAGELPSAATLRDYAAKTLPEYMLPSVMVTLDAFPLSASGKIDRRALPVPESVPGQVSHDAPASAAASDELETKLLGIFRDVLRNPEIGVTDSFFRYGGYSLLTVRLFSRIDRELKVRLPISLLFDAPTVRELARVIQHGVKPSVIVPIRPEGRSAPIFVVQSYLLYGAMLDIVEEDRPIYGVREMANEREPMTVDARARQFSKEIAEVCPEGPVYLAGWCAAGTLTVEIARQLSEAGREVGMVALFDAERPGFTLPKGLKFWLKRSWAKLLYHASRLRSLPWGEKFTYLYEAVERNWDLAVESYYTANFRSMMWLQKKFGLSLSEAAFNSVYANMVASDDSYSRTYPGRLNLYRAKDVPNFAESDDTLGWRTVAEGGVEVDFVPGDHVSMFKKPHISSLAKRLQHQLQRSERVVVQG